MGLFSVDKKVQEIFAFNLLPPKTKEELNEEAKRASMNFYAAMIPSTLLVVSIILFLIHNVALKTNLDNWENSVNGMKLILADTNSQIGLLKVRNGELKTKTDFIEDPVSKNVDFNNIFEVTEKVFKGNKSKSIATSYGREQSGDFVVNGVSPTVSGPQEILVRFQENELVKEARLKSTNKDLNTNEYRFTISFTLSTSTVEENV